MPVNAAEAYLNNKVKTASPAELTLMLYDGIIKFSNIAMIGIEEKDVEKAHINILKAQRIIDELCSTLNKDYTISDDFLQIYDYIYSRLIDANIDKDKSILEEVLEHIRELRDIWKEIMKASKVG